MLNWKVVSMTLGLWTAITFVLCVLWGLVTPESLHMHEVWALLLPGFEWISFGSFLLGQVETFLYGAYAGVIFVPIYNWLSKGWSSQT